MLSQTSYIFCLSYYALIIIDCKWSTSMTSCTWLQQITISYQKASINLKLSVALERVYKELRDQPNLETAMIGAMLQHLLLN